MAHLLTGANTIGTSPVAIGLDNIVFQASGNLTLSGATDRMVLSVGQYLSRFEPMPSPASSWSGTSNSVSIQRVYFPIFLNATRADVLLNISGSSSGALSLRANLGLYTASGSSLGTVSTTSMGLSFNSTSAISYTAVSGPRSWSVALGTWNVTPGEYFLGVDYGWTTASTNTVFIQMYGAAPIGTASGAGTAAFGNFTDYFRTGMIAAAQSTLPDTLPLSAMTQTGAAAAQQPWVAFQGSF